MFNINQKPPIYDPIAVQPMRDEITFVGFKEAVTPQIVEDFLGKQNDETTLVFVNSVCGCSAGSARPGVSEALQNSVIPNNLITVFAGQDRDAVDYFREKYLPQVPPSSPFIALFKNGAPLFVMPRHKIEGRYSEEIAEDLKEVFNNYCNGQGPSVAKEKYAELVHAKMCGSKIPLSNN